MERNGLRRDDFDYGPGRITLDGTPDNFETVPITTGKMETEAQGGLRIESRITHGTTVPSPCP